ncbi:hypothetical protein [Dysgonomonas massiliensis]|uniref:hypothetical protein n=1 Tax=Dysgonomonas massiliensis TaxID=2040292 RepID=UPI000C758FDE|nr:hypothetical protein [Dysgonomonas massiliensis]
MTNDIKKAIEEEAERFNNCVSGFFNVKEAFYEGLKKGIEIIQESTRWRKVEEELPENDILCIKPKTACNGESTKSVIILDNKGCLHLGNRMRIRNGDWFWRIPLESLSEDAEIIEWQPINK